MTSSLLSVNWAANVDGVSHRYRSTFLTTSKCQVAWSASDRPEAGLARDSSDCSLVGFLDPQQQPSASLACAEKADCLMIDLLLDFFHHSFTTEQTVDPHLCNFLRCGCHICSTPSDKGCRDPERPTCTLRTDLLVRSATKLTWAFQISTNAHSLKFFSLVAPLPMTLPSTR